MCHTLGSMVQMILYPKVFVCFQIVRYRAALCVWGQGQHEQTLKAEGSHLKMKRPSSEVSENI